MIILLTAWPAIRFVKRFEGIFHVLLLFSYLITTIYCRSCGWWRPRGPGVPGRNLPPLQP